MGIMACVLGYSHRHRETGRIGVKGIDMAKVSRSEKVPKQMQQAFDVIVAHTDGFCNAHLNEEYAQLARQTAAALSRKRPSPLTRGRSDVWACGIVYAVGSVNFLFDRSEEPYLSSADLCKEFGVGQSTAAGKSKTVRDLLGMKWLDPDWCLPSQLDRNPMVWMVMIDDIVVDSRYLNRDVQEVLVAAGIIPHIPGGRETAGDPA